MGAIMGGIAVSGSHGYGKGPVQAEDSLRYRDTSSVTAVRDIPAVITRPTATPAAKPTATPEPKVTGKVTATPEPKISGKISITPDPKISAKANAKVSSKSTSTPAPKSSGAFAAAQTAVSRIFSFFGKWFK